MLKKYDVVITLSGDPSSIVLGNMASQIVELFEKQFKTVCVDNPISKVKFPSNYPGNKEKSVFIVLGKLDGDAPSQEDNKQSNYKTLHTSDSIIDKFIMSLTSPRSQNFYKILSEVATKHPQLMKRILGKKEKSFFQCKKCKNIFIYKTGQVIDRSQDLIKAWKKYHICKTNKGRDKLFCENSPSETKNINRKSVPNVPKKKQTRKDALIAKALRTKKGRKALGDAMLNPIKKSITESMLRNAKFDVCKEADKLNLKNFGKLKCPDKKKYQCPKKKPGDIENGLPFCRKCDNGKDKKVRKRLNHD